MQVKQLGFLNQFSGDPPAGGSLARGALQKGIVWSTIAPARGPPEMQGEHVFVSTSFRFAHPLVGHRRVARYRRESYRVRLHQPVSHQKCK